MHEVHVGKNTTSQLNDRLIMLLKEEEKNV